MQRTRRNVVAALAAALCLHALPGAARGATDEGKPRSHSLRGMLGKSSWSLKRRPLFEHVLLYVPNRLADLVDCVGIEAGAGWGGHVNVHATRSLQLGYGREESLRAGLMSRRPVVVEQSLSEKALGWWWELDLRRDTLMGRADDIDIGEDDVAKKYYKAADPVGIGLAVFPGIFGVSAEIKGHELVDFVLGFLTLDPIEDDY